MAKVGLKSMTTLCSDSSEDRLCLRRPSSITPTSSTRSADLVPGVVPFW